MPRRTTFLIQLLFLSTVAEASSGQSFVELVEMHLPGGALAGPKYAFFIADSKGGNCFIEDDEENRRREREYKEAIYCKAYFAALVWGKNLGKFGTDTAATETALEEFADFPVDMVKYCLKISSLLNGGKGFDSERAYLPARWPDSSGELGCVINWERHRADGRAFDHQSMFNFPYHEDLKKP